ncbi:MAG: serine hydrolase [Candidatus Enteromonas sp.]|nr:serine hydrolase [Candidatus Enteromonas sp.]
MTRRASISVLLQDFIENDLRLTNTHVGDCGAIVDPIAWGKVKKKWVWRKDNPFLPAGGIASSVEDLMRMAQIVLEGQAEYAKQASLLCPESFHPKRKTMTTYSFHTYHRSHQLWHMGGVGPFRSGIFLNTNRNIAVAVLTNAKGKHHTNPFHICKVIYGRLKRKKKLW